MSFLFSLLSLVTCSYFDAFPEFFEKKNPESASFNAVTIDSLPDPRELYAETILLSQYLFNGPRYHTYSRKEETHQFFKTRDLLSGHIRYDGRDYGPFEMQYDINLGSLVIRQPSNGYLIQLDSSKIEHFNLEDDYFEKIVTAPQLPPGIYQILNDGPTKLYCLRKKRRIEKAENLVLRIEFVDSNVFYLGLNSSFHRIHRKKDLYRLFPNRKQEIRSKLKGYQPRFKSYPEHALLDVVKMIDQQKPVK